MDKKILGLVGAVTILGAPQAVQAAPVVHPGDALRVESYSDLLDPIPNAAAVLKAVDIAASAETPPIVKVQYHHHHHHHHLLQRLLHHHHHHHHRHHHHHHHM